MKNLFGDYVKFLSPNITTIQRLCKIRTQISSNMLHLISQIKYRTRYREGGGEIRDRDGSWETISFKENQDVAIIELQRRGNPPYDSSAYLKKEAWRL